jgi:drug/metabolite transporter, DME family
MQRDPQLLPLDTNHPHGGRGVGVALIISASVLWSLSGVAVKIAQVDPLTFTFWRSAAATAAMAMVLPLTTGRRPDAAWMLLSALVYTLVVTTLIASMTKSTAATGILLQYTAPAFCALLARIFQGRHISRRTMLAMTIALGGVAIMFIGGPHDRGLAGPVYGLISGLCFGALILILEKIDRVGQGQVNPFQIVLFNNMGCALFVLPACLWLDLLPVSGIILGLLAATGVIQLAIPYVLFQLGLRRVHPVDATLLTLLEPVLNPLIVATFTTERPDRATLLGGAAILVALVIEALKPAPPVNPD